MIRDFKTILCPTDFSDESAHALEYGVRFAKSSQGKLLLTHLVHMSSEHYRDEAGHVLRFDDLKAAALRRLEEFRAKFVGDYANCELVVDIGDPHELLLTLATERSVDLIVTSTHESSGIAHMLNASIAETLVRQAPCPVFVVRRGVE